ncbi:MAG: hypothetical protein KGR42_06350 [Acidobacteria bacterium]|nr:hypothetical protein [Acidobacteriota bacterium]
MKAVLRSSRVAAATLAVVLAGGVGVAAASTMTPSNGTSKGVGINQFGMTKAYFQGRTVNFTYTQGFYCDRHVASGATSGCEVGAPFKVAPASNYDPLYITVPLGFNVPMMSMDCPTGLVCVDHPGTIDLSRLESALKGLYPQLSAAQLTAALKNTAVPGHEHFITTQNGGKAEWWDVDVVGVTSLKEWNTINAHRSFNFLNSQVKKGLTTGIIPTNLFLYFSVN